MPKRILVVDDSSEILDLFRDLLSDEGYTVITQHYPIESAAQVRRAAPDLIILDHWMHNKEVSQVAITRIRMAADLAHIPIIICTGFANGQDVQAIAHREKNLQVLSKPFNIDDLYEMVQLLITRAEAQAATANQQIAQSATE